MTNSKKVDDKSLGVEILVKDDFEKQKTGNDNTFNSKETSKPPGNMTNKQDLKILISKSISTKIIKQEVDISKQRVTRNKSKTLSKSQCLTDSSKNFDKLNKINKSSNHNENVVSPNQSITKYFSSLDLKEKSTKNVSVIDKEPNEIVKKIEYDKDHQNSQISHCILASRKKSSHQAKDKQKVSDSGNHKLTEYFAIRRSDRKFKKNIDLEKQKDLENKILSKTEDGLEIKEFKDKGRGIITTKEFNKGDFVIEYVGDLIDRSTAKQRELRYSKNKNVGCYMYYFKHKDQQYCIDATEESGKLGRLINHSRKGNLTSRIVEVNTTPHLVLFAKSDISIGTELLYDYGDRNQESIKNYPWLNL